MQFSMKHIVNIPTIYDSFVIYHLIFHSKFVEKVLTLTKLIYKLFAE